MIVRHWNPQYEIVVSEVYCNNCLGLIGEYKSDPVEVAKISPIASVIQSIDLNMDIIKQCGMTIDVKIKHYCAECFDWNANESQEIVERKLKKFMNFRESGIIEA